MDGLETLFVFGIGLMSYALPTLLGGNGYLDAYITGLIVGNATIPRKGILVHFFE